MTITELETKIAQVRKNLDSNKAKLEQLRIERGQLAIENSKANAATIKRLDSQIDSVRKDVENGPVELRILQDKLTAEQKRLAQEQRDELLNQQKAAARKSEKLSKELVNALEKAVTINSQLLAANDHYRNLQKQTGQDVMSMNVTRGSFGFLKVVYDYCSAELRGERPNRPILQPPYQYI